MSAGVFALSGAYGPAGHEVADAMVITDTLVDRVRRGDAAAVGEVYEQHHAPVRSFARRLVGDEAAAEDLLHEVFVSLPRAIRGFRGQSSLRTFLLSIAVNHARHHVRAAARRRAAMDRFAREPEGPADGGPDGAVARRELATMLARALDALPLDQRVAFVLCEVEERTSTDAAAVLGVPEGTVRTRLFHARRRLREHFESLGIVR